jgi:hypothetical protein
MFLLTEERCCHTRHMPWPTLSTSEEGMDVVRPQEQQPDADCLWGSDETGSTQVASRWTAHYAQLPTLSTANWYPDLRSRGRARSQSRGAAGERFSTAVTLAQVAFVKIITRVFRRG